MRAKALSKFLESLESGGFGGPARQRGRLAARPVRADVRVLPEQSEGQLAPERHKQRKEPGPERQRATAAARGAAHGTQRTQRREPAERHRELRQEPVPDGLPHDFARVPNPEVAGQSVVALELQHACETNVRSVK